MLQWKRGVVFRTLTVDLNNLSVLFTSLPGRYAKALFAEGLAKSCLDNISQDFASLQEFFGKNPTVRKLLTSHSLNKNDFDAGWLSLAEHLSLCPVFLNFIKLLVENKRFGLLDSVRRIYDTAVAKHNGVRVAKVFSVAPLSPTQKRQTQSAITKVLKNATSGAPEKLVAEYEIDEKILGGLIVSSENGLIDASVRTQIRQLSDFYRNLDMEGVRL
ncbi:MAG: ATP synthase F1 subunit delta [Alphaproteobacteria bacterium]|nr:ATP synthase F1 subunit delta [Alphaproteobacteria bacterium]